MPKSDPEGQIFLSTPNNRDRFFFLHTFWSAVFGFNIGVAFKESCWRLPYWKLTSYVMSQMTSTLNILMTELCDLLYNQYIDNMLLFDFYLSHRSDKGM